MIRNRGWGLLALAAILQGCMMPPPPPPPHPHRDRLPPEFVQACEGQAEGAGLQITGAVEDTVSSVVVAQLLFLEADNPKKEIAMYINSPGGVVTSGLAVYDTMQFVRPAVSTLCVGQAASMGSLLLAAGAKDLRFALPNARIMIHQPSGGFQGQATDIMLHAQEILNLKKRLNEIYVKHTGQPLRKIEDALERDTFLTAEMARDFGIVDQVIDKRPVEEAAPKP